jgi:hypothetical protein
MFQYSNKSKYIQIANKHKGKKGGSGKPQVIAALRKAGYFVMDTSIEGTSIHRLTIERNGFCSEIEFDRNEPRRWYACLRW